MKISYRILIINFAIVVLILGSSAIAFYTIMYQVLSSQQSKYLLNSANELIYAYRNIIQDTDDDFRTLAGNNPENIFSQSLSNKKDIDFVLKTADESSGRILNKLINGNVELTPAAGTIDDFVKENPYAVIKTEKLKSGFYYYGRIITNDFLNNLSKKINAEVAAVWDGTPALISNESINQKYYYSLSNAYKDLSSKGNFDVYGQSGQATDILATIYKPQPAFKERSDVQFLIFTTLNEAADLRTNLKDLLIIIGLAGVALSLILTMVFTDKLRKQITKLSRATEITKEGNFENKIEIKNNDELGKLASAFNTMLDELKKNEKSKREYSEFITLINRNPTLKEISEAALKKIIETCRFAVGALFTIENDKINLTSSYGIGREYNPATNSEIFEIALRDQKILEISSGVSLPVVSAGAFSLEVKYLLIVPIFYNNKPIAVLELGAFEKPAPEAAEYLEKIKEQLAIGLTNAMAFVQLENLVEELKQLNEDYQKQNLQVRKQNETLLDLHKKVKEKAGELEVQKQRAEEATRLKSEFLASMSHELRTPMNSVLGLTQLILEDKTLSGKNRERMEVVLKNSRRLMGLINDILDLSKIEAGRMSVHNEDIMLEELLREVENSISPLAAQKGITFKVVKNLDTKVIVNTDRGKVTQVLINLLGNAVKFTDNGFVELHVSQNGNRELRFDVIDSGIGISKEDQIIIFEEFRQIDGTTTRKYDGTGLGLAICKKIAGMLNGTISVESEPGKGSIFTFTLPLLFIRTKAKMPDAGFRVDALIKNRKNPILVIDSDPEVRYTIGQYLSARGYDVVYASEGNEGIKKAVKFQPFAVTLDVMMPDKNGWIVLEELKNNPLTKDIPVILISIMGDKNLGFGLGAFEYFYKPVVPDQIMKSLKKLENLVKKPVEKIVIVDDDENEFEIFKEAFKDEKIRIDYIKDSELAFSKILEVQPDLIVLDLLMPNVDGVTLTNKLKSNNDTKHIPIIISTAKDLSDEERNSLNNIVEDITVKSKGHPLDVLKVVRDRIKMHETFTDNETSGGNTGTGLSFTQKNAGDLAEKKIFRGEVLIVDDDPDSLFTLNEIVQACDCRTKLAKNGLECLRLLEVNVPDLILLDIMMPEMDGFQTINRIRQNSNWATIPVFAVTAKAMLDDKEVILRHGFDDYIAKPVNSGVMAFKIERLFSKIKLK